MLRSMKMDTGLLLRAEGDDPTDGAMRTGRQTVSIGGEDYIFYFETSGSKKGRCNR